MSLHVIILAAGLGKRMHSSRPKVLHELAGKPLLSHVVETARCLQPSGIHVVIGHGAEQIQQALPELSVDWVLQAEQLGTGHAVLQAVPLIPPGSLVLILYADVPLIQVDTLAALVKACREEKSGQIPLALLLAKVKNPSGLGRILRDEQGQVCAIVEDKDCQEAQRQIEEIYSGICCSSIENLQRWLPKLNQSNAQGEYYLTDSIAMAVNEKTPIVSLQVGSEDDIQGVNNKLQLQQVERVWQARYAQQLMLQGVSLADASRIDVRGELHCGKDVFIDVNTVFSGNVILGDGCKIGAHCSLNQVSIGAHSEVLPNSVLDGCELGEHCQIGPFARLRPGTQLASFCKIGNFVETKNAVFDEHSKANHLSYLGDVTVGKKVNIGAGTITCNYDGANKHRTVIEDGAFIGSGTQLVAPVHVGENATIGAGTTLRKNAPDGELSLTQSKQVTLYGWTRPKK
jgi:bifunctional UDP-N-acetylglucosamine pyrophosphorylase/glucosamine-1-phosphate N-acetyltransferase